MKVDNQNYPYLSFKKGDLLPEINLPEKVFPPKFNSISSDYLAMGYFVSYNTNPSIEETTTKLQKRDWNYFAKIIGDFLIIFYDINTRQLFVLTDQTGKFPCYFSIEDNNLNLSTHFSVVKNIIKNKVIDLDTALDFIPGSFIGSLTDKTILKGVNQIPPGCLLQVDHNFNYQISSFVRLDDFFKVKVRRYSSDQKFADDLLLELEHCVKQILSKLGKLKITADVSSGFDCTILCYLLKQLTNNNFEAYSIVSKFANKDTVPEVLAEFVKKHQLKLNIVVGDDFYPFGSDFFLQWIRDNFYPAVHSTELEYRLELAKQKDGAVLSFNGSGGDEIYGASELENTLSFNVQDVFFHTVWAVKNHQIGELFTKKGQQLLLNKDRFTERNHYPLLISSTAALCDSLFFPIRWQSGIWPITPYSDPRITQFARSMPKKDRKEPVKTELWKHREDIFTQSQFRPKGLPTLAERFLTEKRQLIIGLLKNSVLGDSGIVDHLSILKDFENNKIEKYQNPASGLSTCLQQLLILEYFLQQNNVTYNKT